MLIISTGGATKPPAEGEVVRLEVFGLSSCYRVGAVRPDGLVGLHVWLGSDGSQHRFSEEPSLAVPAGFLSTTKVVVLPVPGSAGSSS